MKHFWTFNNGSTIEWTDDSDDFLFEGWLGDAFMKTCNEEVIIMDISEKSALIKSCPMCFGSIGKWDNCIGSNCMWWVERERQIGDKGDNEKMGHCAIQSKGGT